MTPVDNILNAVFVVKYLAQITNGTTALSASVGIMAPKNGIVISGNELKKELY